MINKQNSLELMEKFNKIVTNEEDIMNKMDTINDVMEKKLSIINAFNQYSADELSLLKITEKMKSEDLVVFGLDGAKYGLTSYSIAGGTYGKFGQTIHPIFTKLPDQIFNFMTSSGPLFKDNAIVKFIKDGKEDYSYKYCNILKYENDVSKEDVFDFETNDTLTLSVQVNTANPVNGTKCNMIELCPYLPGSFDITDMRIWTMDQYHKNDLDTGADWPNSNNKITIKNVGAERIYLNETIDIYKIEFDIKINYAKDGYPFGFRHIYFYDADMDIKNSYVVVEVNRNDYINSINEDVEIITPYAARKSKLETEGIEFYMFYENNTLQNKIEGSISRNLNTVYAKIPVNESLLGIRFDIETR